MTFAFATVIYPGGLKFWNDFILSLKNQTFKKFKLIVLNDGCDIDALSTGNLDLEFIEARGQIIENRNQLIAYLLEKNYDWVVFGDCDDYFESNRMEQIASFNKNYDLIANDIIPVINNRKGDKVFSKVLNSFQEIDLDFIRDKNLFGLSNVACKTAFLKNIVLPNNLIAADWSLFTKVIMNGAKACFTNRTVTYYRQWGENLIGIENESKQKIITGIKVKYHHYKFMSDFDKYYAKELYWLNKLYNLVESKDIDTYCNHILELNSKSIFWWENIKNIKNEKYKN